MLACWANRSGGFKVFRSVLLGLSLSLIAGAAVAAEPFDLFSATCLSTDARREVVADTLTKAEWLTLPGEMVGMRAQHGEEPWVAYARPEDLNAPDLTTIKIFLTGWTTAQAFIDIPDLGAEFCALLNSGDKALADRKMEQLFGFAPQEIRTDQVWIFSRDGAGYRAEPDFMSLSRDEVTALTTERQVYIAATIPGDGVSITLIGAIRPRT